MSTTPRLARVLLLLLTILSAPLAAADAPATATQAEETGRMSPLQARLYRSVDLERFSPSLPLEGLVRLPTEAGNAADHYAKLETLYLREKHEDGMGVPIDSEGVMEILAASRIRDCRLTPTWYPHMSVGTARQPDLLVYHAYLEALLEAAERLEDAGNLKGASTVHQAGIVWGWHFMNDRSSLVTFLLGLSIQAKAGEAYADFLKRNMHVQKGRKVDDYVEAIGDLRRRTFVKANIHLGDMANFHCLFSAIRVAKEDADYFWRQEAVLRLGVFQHGAPDTIQGGLVTNAAHQETARAALAAIAAAGDERPWIRELAAWTGENMTPERYAEIRAEGIFRVSSEVLDEGGEEVTTNPARPTESVTP